MKLNNKRNIAILIISLIPVVLAYFYVLYFGVNVIVNDEWEIVATIDKIFSGNCSFNHLIQPHNEHIIFFPQIFMILLAILSKFNNLVESYTILFLLVTALFIYYLYFKKSFSLRKVGFGFIPIPFLVFNLRQHGNMLNGFQLTFIFALMFSLLAFYFIFILSQSKRLIIKNTSFIAATICATIAAYSSSMGMFVWIAGLIQILISLKRRKSKIIYSIVWFCMGLMEWIIYVLLTRGRVQIDIKNIINKFPDFLKYFFRLIGNSLFGNSILSLISGVVVIIIIVLCIIIIKKNKRLIENSFSLSLIVFSLLTVLSITIGRALLKSRVPYPSRYTTFTILLIIALYMILLDLNLFTKGRLYKILRIVLVGLIILSTFISYYECLAVGQKFNAHRREQAFILYTYKTQPTEILRRIYPPSGEKIEKYAPVLERLNYNVFSDEQKFPKFNVDLPTNKEESLMRIDVISINDDEILEKGCEIIYPYREENFIAISGWAVDSEAKDVASGVYIKVDGKFYPAYYGIDRKDVADHYQNNNYRYSGYVRYIRFLDIGSGIHDIGVNIISKDEQTYYDTGTFKLYLTASEEKANINSSSFVVEDDSRYRINMDEYKPDSIISNDVVMKGWVIDQKDIDYSGKVTILFYDGPGPDDENYIGIADYYLFRSDVAEAFGIDEYRYSGFEYSLDTTKLENGYHDIYIYALNEDEIYSKQLFEFIVRN